MKLLAHSKRSRNDSVLLLSFTIPGVCSGLTSLCCNCFFFFFFKRVREFQRHLDSEKKCLSGSLIFAD